MRNVEDKVVEKIKTSILCPIIISENRAVYQIMWNKCGTARQAKDGKIIRRMGFEFWIIRAIDKHSEYALILVLITSPRQQLLREDA
jgi:hypothetical protein